MKTLILTRHAKSSWANPEVDDRDRPLNKRGMRAAADLGHWFRTQGPAPDLILCSSARRTRETLERMKLEAPVELRDDIYEAPPGTLLAAVQDAHGDTVMLIGHNPGIGALAHMLAAQPPDHPRFDDYPTGATAILRFQIDDWARIQPASGQVAAFLTPHDIAAAA